MIIIPNLLRLISFLGFSKYVFFTGNHLSVMNWTYVLPLVCLLTTICAQENIVFEDGSPRSVAQGTRGTGRNRRLQLTPFGRNGYSIESVPVFTTERSTSSSSSSNNVVQTPHVSHDEVALAIAVGTQAVNAMQRLERDILENGKCIPLSSFFQIVAGMN